MTLNASQAEQGAQRTSNNFDQAELDKFGALAQQWWDRDGNFKPLHDINPLRLGYIEEHSGSLADKKVLDVGCGGGILSESMARRGAQVTAIDLSEAPLAVAKLHLAESGLEVDYQLISVEDLAEQQPGSFDVVTCMEMLEHVPDPAAIIAACKKLVKPGGQVFFSTINRNPKSYLFAIIGAERILKLLPVGTHEYQRFIRPSELANWTRHAGLNTRDQRGLHYNPLTRRYWLSSNIDVNYMVHCQRPQDNA
ncbi:bifunctional 2-polyprenyl-6-hydroxyphenol methylase/3-demethylubiquinol 3-O-methyltransferase UbiG [Carnimonas bestiolae]|uniref:bifunctional 2-polyprenyl-6-hydroxyphenol methylase/3-demethylubiquinol 3-O-methyltransferase UbiG n=1 Tax=Carnimonas bestiolae TaxID=3402172 RepID=UPI003EDC615D